MFDNLFGPEGAKRDGAEILQALRKAASERILILDGAMGTQIQGLGFDEDHFRGERFIGCACHQQGNNDLLILTQPNAIEDIHFRYAMAGADILETNTFSSTTIAQADYGMEEQVYELNRDGARLARRAALRAEQKDGRRRFVADALTIGKLKSWDHQPLVDASQQYMRNHIDLDDLERKARYPQPCQNQ